MTDLVALAKYFRLLLSGFLLLIFQTVFDPLSANCCAGSSSNGSIRASPDRKYPSVIPRLWLLFTRPCFHVCCAANVFSCSSAPLTPQCQLLLVLPPSAPLKVRGEGSVLAGSSICRGGKQNLEEKKGEKRREEREG